MASSFDLIAQARELTAEASDVETFDADAWTVAFDTWLAAVDDKVPACCAVMERADNEANLYRAKAKAFEARAKRLDDVHARVKANATALMVEREAATGEKKLDSGDYKVTLVRKPVESVTVDDPSLLPDDLRRVTIAGDKAAIKAALKAGRQVVGCAIEVNESIYILVK